MKRANKFMIAHGLDMYYCATMQEYINSARIIKTPNALLDFGKDGEYDKVIGVIGNKCNIKGLWNIKMK